MSDFRSGPVAPRGLRVLAVTGGHRVDGEAFGQMLEAVCGDRGWAWAHGVQPGAQRWLRPEHAGRWDAILLHDIPGLRLRRGEEPEPQGPAAGVAEALLELLDAGQGLVVLHHALSAWPDWEGWAEAIGGRFLYRPGWLRGQTWPASGYRMARYTVEVMAPEHPVCAGVSDFEIDDELYYAPVLTDRVTPLLRARTDFDGADFLCAHDVVRHGASTGATCAGRPPASDLVGWVSTAGRSPVVVLQPGDGPSTFAHPSFQQLLANALAWVASAPAHAQAAADPVPVPGPQVRSAAAGRTGPAPRPDLS
jgi:type 1 glutamine amidotransferase